MKIVTDKIKLSELKEMARNRFGDFVKAVVDVEKGIMALDADLHSDQETLLLENGSGQKNLWGINLYVDLPENQRIEFDSMINLRPSFGNRSRGVDDSGTQEKIIRIVNQLIEE